MNVIHMNLLEARDGEMLNTLKFKHVDLKYLLAVEKRIPTRPYTQKEKDLSNGECLS